MSCILDTDEPYWCEADCNCKDCPNWMEDKEVEGKMGMTLDEARTALGKERKYALHENKQAFDIAMDTMRKYQQLRVDYENRLKADMVAMLTEIQMEIEELDTPNNGSAYMDCVEIIQQKIDALKGENT